MTVFEHFKNYRRKFKPSTIFYNNKQKKIFNLFLKILYKFSFLYISQLSVNFIILYILHNYEFIINIIYIQKLITCEQFVLSPQNYFCLTNLKMLVTVRFIIKRKISSKVISTSLVITLIIINWLDPVHLKKFTVAWQRN